MTKNDIDKSLGKLISRKKDIAKYTEIMNSYMEKNISEDETFQRKFNGFYRVRRKETWRNIYYEYFEMQKNNKEVSFEQILQYIYINTGRIEASFSSKMLATINPQKPIWDSIVLDRLGLKLTGKTAEIKLENAIRLYKETEAWYENFLKKDLAHLMIMEFDKIFPEYVLFSNVKKIDFILWGSPENTKMGEKENIK